ncbi:hypothetical protein RND71_017941 [Anisodus tanguticus]|uniref:Ubiquitin-like protease family profile domain-containing protein n=1 Tax=Anisodus tanguticus TaxID=243964 RepID=A0AAE1S399_9SOLA|nr:hypothetical protein RND71_017941 [Anisodus tanguticus]
MPLAQVSGIPADPTLLAQVPGISAVPTPQPETRIRRKGKFEVSPYVNQFGSGSSSVALRPVRFFNLKHPFTVKVGTEVDTKLCFAFQQFVDRYMLRKSKVNVYQNGKSHMNKPYVFGDQLIQNREWTEVDLWITRNWDYGVINDDHEIAECILGGFMPCNVPWNTIDHVLIPIGLEDKKIWVLGVLIFKERCIYIYDSIQGVGHRAKIRQAVLPYAVMISIFLKYFIHQIPIPVDDFEVEPHCRRIGTLLWNYGRSKQQGAESEPENC